MGAYGSAWGSSSSDSRESSSMATKLTTTMGAPLPDWIASSNSSVNYMNRACCSLRRIWLMCSRTDSSSREIL